MRWFALVGVVLLSGCAPDGCPGGRCDCGGTNVCEFVCAHEPCSGVCENLSECVGACGDACDLSCRSASGCDFDCGDDCAVTCQSVSTCVVSCDEGCAVDCADLSTCAVTMRSGEVSCQRAGTCDVQCVQPDGRRVAANDCGSGIYRCGPC
jgi:hypothetical protein